MMTKKNKTVWNRVYLKEYFKRNIQLKNFNEKVC